MAVQNPPEVASADTPRPSWSWGNAGTEAPAAPSHGALAAPDVEPPSVELSGRVAAPAAVAAPPAPAPARRAIPSLLLLLAVALLAMGLSLTTIMSAAAAEVVLGSAAVVLVVAAMSGLVRG
jgi:hypothetical protein